MLFITNLKHRKEQDKVGIVTDFLKISTKDCHNYLPSECTTEIYLINSVYVLLSKFIKKD